MDFKLFEDTGEFEKDYKKFFEMLKLELSNYSSRILCTSSPYTNLSNETGIHRSHLSKFLKGESRISVQKLSLLAEVLKLNPFNTKTLFIINTAIELKREGLDHRVSQLLGVNLATQKNPNDILHQIALSGETVHNLLLFFVANQIKGLEGSIEKISKFTKLSLESCLTLKKILTEFEAGQNQFNKKGHFLDISEENISTKEKIEILKESILNDEEIDTRKLYVRTTKERYDWLLKNKTIFHKVYIDSMHVKDGDSLLDLTAITKLFQPEDTET